jgi:hypothetical protein
MGKTAWNALLTAGMFVLLASSACKDADGDGAQDVDGGAGVGGAGSHADAGHGGAAAGAGGSTAAGSSSEAGSHADDGGVPNQGDACSLPPSGGNCRALIPRYYHDPASGSCERFVWGGCGGNANNFETLAACEDACDVSPRAEPCSIEATDPSLPGVRVRIESERCRVQSGYAQEFHYTVEVDQPIAYTAPDSGGACGRCGGYTDDPLSLVSYAIEGDPSHFCLCDVGCCPPTTAVEQTLRTGSFEDVIEWPGWEWNGPSDTNQPLGEPFTPGAYEVVVTFEVPGEGTVEARLPIDVYRLPPADPGAVACEVGETVYSSGTDGIDDPISCNTCSCFEGELACTDIACPVPCPMGTAFAVSCAQCGPADGCEIVRYSCLPSCDDQADCETASCIDGVCKDLCG